MTNKQAAAKLMEAYKEMAESKTMYPYVGLCNVIRRVTYPRFQEEFAQLFKPNYTSRKYGQGNTYSPILWGYDISAKNKRYNEREELYAFHDLRQTLLLLFIEHLKNPL